MVKKNELKYILMYTHFIFGTMTAPDGHLHSLKFFLFCCHGYVHFSGKEMAKRICLSEQVLQLLYD